MQTIDSTFENLGVPLTSDRHEDLDDEREPEQGRDRIHLEPDHGLAERRR